MIIIPFDFKKNKKQVTIFIALMLLVLLFLHFNFLLRPQIIGVMQITGEVGRMTSDLSRALTDISNIDKYKKDIEARSQKISSYENMLPIEQEIPSLLEELSSMAKTASVKIVEIVPVATKQDKVQQPHQIYQDIPILISARCGYHELGKFLSNMESANRFMKVVDIHIKSSRDALKKHDVELLVLTYILLKGK